MTNFKVLQKAYQVIKELDDKVKNNYKFEFRPQAPDPNVNYHFNSFTIPHINSRKQKSAKSAQARLLSFYNLKKYVTLADETVMYLPVTSKKLQQIFGNAKAVSRAIDTMIKCGLLAEYNESYSFNNYGKFNHSKQYVFNKVAWQQYVKYCNNNNIEAECYINKEKVNNRSIVDTFVGFSKSNVVITSKGNWYKPEDLTEQQFEELLYSCLKNNYGRLLCNYQSLAQFINQTYYKDEEALKISYEPTFTWNKSRTKVTKIGIRATNSLVSAKTKKEADDPDYMIYREDLKQQFGLLHEYDVKSSISKITVLLNKEEWLADEVDCYKLMFDEFCRLENIEQEWNEQVREVFKYFFMRGYFDTYAMISAHTKRAISLKGNYKAEEWKELDRIMTSYKKAIENTLGQLYDSEIFLHESNIYMRVANRILSQGYKLMQVYDAFYTDKPVENLSQIIKEEAYSYLEEYKSNKERHSQIINKESKEVINEYNKVNNQLLIRENISNRSIVDKVVLAQQALENDYNLLL